MIGNPKHLNSKDDYLNVQALALAGEADKAAMMARWQSLLASASHYVFERVMAAGEQPPAPEPACRVCEETREGVAIRTLFWLEADLDCAMARLGFTADEINNHITELGN